MKLTKRIKTLRKTRYRMPQAGRKRVEAYRGTPAKRSPSWYAWLIEYLYQ